MEWLPSYPFSLAATNLAISGMAIWFVIPALANPYYLTLYLRALTYFVFWGSFALLLINLYLWLREQGL
jgi:hypothetical protein